MFRDFTRREAKKRGITGEVENIHDGGVRIVAEGEEKVLYDFLSSLRVGPFFSQVEKIDTSWDVFEGTHSDFVIVYKNFFDRF